MTLATELAAALADPLALMIAEFGQTARLRRRDEGEATDGSRVSTLNRVPGAPEPFGLLPQNRTAYRVAQDWGRDREVAFEAYIMVSVPVQEGDLVRVMTGDFTGRWLEAWRSRREPAGGITLWAFSDAGDADTLDDLDQGF